jgi:hypothetical protein
VDGGMDDLHTLITTVNRFKRLPVEEENGKERKKGEKEK